MIPGSEKATAVLEGKGPAALVDAMPPSSRWSCRPPQRRGRHVGPCGEGIDRYSGERLYDMDSNDFTPGFDSPLARRISWHNRKHTGEHAP